MTLEFLFWAMIAGALGAFWWQSDKIKSQAMAQVFRYCREQGLQPLDQSMVLKGVWPIRTEQGSLTLRRRYQFEFSSTAETRYRGNVELHGRHIAHIEMEAHVLPDDHTLH